MAGSIDSAYSLACSWTELEAEQMSDSEWESEAWSEHRLRCPDQPSISTAAGMSPSTPPVVAHAPYALTLSASACLRDSD